MREYYIAESLKNRHTFAGKLVWIMPLTVVALSARLTWDYFTIDCYNWWYTVLFPGMAAFLCGAVGNRDKKLGNRAIWTLPAEPGNIWDGKILYGIRCMGTALLVLGGVTLAAGIGMEQILHRVLRISLTPGQQIFAVLILFTVSLWQIPFCLFLQQAVGTFPMVLLHMGMWVLCSAELSLKPYFWVLPGGIASRMMCIILGILPNGLVAEPGSMTYSPELMERTGLPLGIAASLIWFFLFWRLSRRWFERKVER